MGGKLGQYGGQMMEDSNRVRALEMRLSEFVSSFFLALRLRVCLMFLFRFRILLPNRLITQAKRVL